MTVRTEIIGDATLYLGSSVEVLPTLPPVDLVVTDPPYLVTSGGFGALDGSFGGWMKEAYDNKGAIVECAIDWGDWLKLLPPVLRENAHVYIFSNDRNLTVARIEAEKAGLIFHRLLVWDKRTALPNRWYQQTCEFVLFMRKGKAFMIADPSSKALQSIFQRDESDHPTEKPVELCALYIKNSTKVGDVVLDPFMGSGTTGVAALRVGRKFIGVELTQKYFDTACRRIEAALTQGGLFTERTPKAVQQAISFDTAAGE